MNKRGIIILLLIVLMGIGITLYFAPAPGNSSMNLEQNSLTVLLQPNIHESGIDLEEDIEILSRRLDFILGKNEYSLIKQDNGLLLSFSEKKLQNLSYNEFFEQYISEPGRMNIAEERSNWGFISVAYPTADDFLSIEKKQGFRQRILIDGEEQSTEENEEDLSDQPYLEIIFSSEIADKLKEYLESSDSGKLYLVNNIRYDDYKTNDLLLNGFQLYPDNENPSVCYLPYSSEDDELSGFEDAFIYNLTHEYLHQPFNYYIQEKEEWQNVTECDYPGNFQCNVEDFTEDYYTIRYSYKMNRMTKDEVKYLERTMKSKLDRIGDKYSFGWNENGTFFIKMPTSHINKQVLETIGNDGNLYFRYGKKQWILSERDIVRYNPEEQAITVLMESSNVIREKTKSPGKNLYLYLENLPIAVLKLNDSVYSDEVTFRKFCFDDKKELNDENRWFLEYVSLIIENRGYNSTEHKTLYLELDNYCYNDKEYFDNYHFGMKPSYIYDLKDEENKIHEICPEATVEKDINYKKIAVHLNHPLDNNLISDSMKNIKKIYETIDFENGNYDSIWFYPFDPVEDEKAWIVFDKFSSDGTEDKEVYFDGYFCNGRMNAYIDDLKKYIQEDTFFKKYTFRLGYNYELGGWHIE